MANEVYSKSYWGVGAITNSIGWGIIYKNLVGLISEILSSLKDRSVYYENEENTEASLLEIEQCKILDKASILITPTSYGDGILNAALPIKKFGVEQVVNGDFSNGLNGWTQNASANGVVNVVNGQLVYSSPHGDYAETKQINNSVIGKTYLVEFDVVSVGSQSTTISFQYGRDTFLSTAANLIEIKRYSFTAISTNTDGFNISARTDAEITIDNVSAKEVISADLDLVRGSLASRTNSVGDIDNVDMLGVEKVDNGNFEELGVEKVANGNFETDSDWTKSSAISIESGKAYFDGSQVTSNLTQGISFLIGKTYVIQYEITSYTSGLIKAIVSGESTQENSSVGVYLYQVTATSSNFLTFRGLSTFIGSIDNVSIKQVDPNDEWTKGAGWSIEGGKLKHTGGDSDAFQSFFPGFLNGKTISVTYTISDYISGDVSFAVFNPSNTSGITRSSNGTFTEVITINTNGGQIGLRAKIGNDFIGSIDNFSVKEVIEITNLPRISYDGFTGTENVLGDEVNEDVEFNTPADWNLTGQSVVENGKAHILQSDSGNTGITSNTTITNKTYLITGVISDYVEGSVRFASLGSTNNVALPQENGSFSVEYTSTRSTLSTWNIQRLVSPVNLKLDNVSVKEIIKVNKTGGKGHILLEGQATNLVEYSEDFSNAYWEKVSGEVVVTSNQSISPSGDNDADLFYFNSGFTRLSTILSVTENTNYTLSYWVKSIDISSISFRLQNTSMSITTNYENQLEVGVWKKVYFNFTTDAGVTSINPQITRNGVIGESAYFWGAQLKEGDLSTYIPTSGGIATRLAETLSRGGLEDFIDSEAGVLYAEISALADDGTLRALALSSLSTTNRICIFYSSNSNQITYQVVVNNVVQSSYNYILSDCTNFSKVAVKFKENDFSFWIDGLKVYSDTIGTTFSINTLTKIGFNLGDTSTFPFYGKTKTLAVFKEALTDTELQCLTTQS